MGFFGSLFGFDQSMAACNAVMADYLLKRTSPAERQKIAAEVVEIIKKVQPRQTTEKILQDLSTRSRVVQMNFVALACDNLGISPPVRSNVWTRIKNPYNTEIQVDEVRIDLTVDAFLKQDGVHMQWGGRTPGVDFTRIYSDGSL